MMDSAFMMESALMKYFDIYILLVFSHMMESALMMEFRFVHLTRIKNTYFVV